MRALGRRDQLPGGPEMVPIAGVYRLEFTNADLTPKRFPAVPKGQSLVCGLDTLMDGEQLFECGSFEDMLYCDGRYGAGFALGIHWYFVVDAKPV